MNELLEHRLHKLYIVFPLINSLKALLPVIILFSYKIFGGKTITPAVLPWMIVAVITGIALLLLYGWLQWNRFVYRLSDDRIVIRRGVIFREELSIYTGRIHSMNMEQPFVQRILGLTQVKLDTPGKSDEDGGRLPAVSSSEALRLQQWLRERTAPSEVRNPEAAPDMANIVLQEQESAKQIYMNGSHLGDNPISAIGKPEGSPAKSNADAATNIPSALQLQPSPSVTLPVEERSVLLTLSPGRLFIAALTSFNLSLAFAFAAGVFSVADDILPDKLYARLFWEAGSWLPGGWFAIVPVAIVLAWILSGILFTVKYAGFKVERVGKQIAVTSGLLDRKQLFFSPKRVQAVSVKEGLLRQPFGYAEVKLHVLTSESEKHLMLHPMLPMKQVGKLLEQIVPQFKAETADRKSPRRALWMTLQLDVALTAAVCAICIGYFKMPGLWSLLLLPLSILWTALSYRDRGFALREKQLTMRSRTISRITRYVRRPQVVALQVTATRRQKRRNLRSFKVSLIASQYNQSLSHLEQSDVEEIWHWFRLRPNNSE
ncbi:PH domain-containing protein [Paenibacillus sp. HJL G12]|uniref:PH domain-containing protein n=2 Tax=Paenibacillus dendrobii TaxID=2691084 RepID=A0A7X3IQS7_9BACL|nr:PH domain-containing protein [Paenibacillus dendrobii]